MGYHQTGATFSFQLLPGQCRQIARGDIGQSPTLRFFPKSICAVRVAAGVGLTEGSLGFHRFARAFKNVLVSVALPRKGGHAVFTDEESSPRFLTKVPLEVSTVVKERPSHPCWKHRNGPLKSCVFGRDGRRLA